MTQKMTRRSFLGGAVAAMATATSTTPVLAQQSLGEQVYIQYLNRTASEIKRYLSQSSTAPNEMFRRTFELEQNHPNPRVHLQAQFFVDFVRNVHGNPSQSTSFTRLSGPEKTYTLYCAFEYLEVAASALAISKERNPSAISSTTRQIRYNQNQIARFYNDFLSISKLQRGAIHQCDYRQLRTQLRP